MNYSHNSDVHPETAKYREAAFPVDPLFLNRWSPRSFKQTEIPQHELFSLFEAARWAPSASNEQPWRFIVAHTKHDKQLFYPFIAEGNRVWCEKAPVLAVALSQKTTSKGNLNRTHAFDAGTAWGYLALEATRRGMITHAMGGFDAEKAKIALGVPDHFELHCVIAIGYRGDVNELGEALQEREKPSSRRPISETIFEGTFGQKMKKLGQT